jgi:sporulation protein YlmC with PRC-barrel domain
MMVVRLPEYEPGRTTSPSEEGDPMNILNSGRHVLWLIAVLMVAAPVTIQAQAVDVVAVDVVAVAKGYRVSKLLGRDVINDQNEDIGEIDDFIIGRDQVLFVILQVGGFLGIGEHLVAFPASSVDLETVKGKIRIKNASRAQLKKQPQFNYRDQVSSKDTPNSSR